MKIRYPDTKTLTAFLSLLLPLCVIAAAVLAPHPSHAEGIDKRSILKIYTIRSSPNYLLPWTMKSPSSATGTGSMIEGDHILTNAHVVGDQTFIQVKRHGDARRHQARVVSVSHELDLALLTVDDEGFFDGVEPLALGELPSTQQEVVVYGFPYGGETLSITKGVISRVEHQTYAHSSGKFLAGQIDAAINPGNSGGPVIVDSKIVGVVMQTISNAENIGYMVPSPVIRHFLRDIADGTHDGIPTLGILLQSMENPDLKRSHRMETSESGVRVLSVLAGSPADGKLLAGDVITAIDGYDVDDEGDIEFRPSERTSLSFAVQQHQVGESVELELVRDGEPRTVSLTLTRTMKEDNLIPYEEYDVRPSYYIYGGLVFTRLTGNYLKSWGRSWYNSAPRELVTLFENNFPEVEGQQVVLLTKVLASDVNVGYHDVRNWIVNEVDGKGIVTLRDLVRAVENGPEEGFIEFKNELGEVIVLDRRKVRDSKERILGTYRIKDDRSEGL